MDVLAFDAAVQQDDAPSLEKAVALYQGPLLEGMDAEWVLPERAARRETFHTALERLAALALSEDQPSAAVGYLRRLIGSDPLRESGHAALMEALAACGDMAGVKQVYRDLRLLLRREQLAEPSRATTALFERLQQPISQPVLLTREQDAPSRNLPVPLTRLIGREYDIAEVSARLGKDRLVTLTGLGGVGKTRLALAVAEAVASEFCDGVWLVELAGLSDPALLASTVAQALRVQEQAGQTMQETLEQALSTRRLLLVMDNCEHLLSASVELIEGLLSRCGAGLRVLATSRERLGLFGERIYSVPTLSVPSPSETASSVDIDNNATSRLLDYAAVQLFVERAAAQRMGRPPSGSQLLAVGAMCRVLEGIPLAIEMAAARARSFPIEEFLEKLTDRFGLLEVGRGTSLERHQTLRKTMDWSYNLLEEKQKALLRGLSVFTDGCRREAAQTVCVGDGIAAKAVLDLLTSLVDKSLVVYQERQGKARYHLLETVRQYAKERLQESGESKSVKARHQDYFLALAEEAEPNLRGPEQAEWLNRLEVEHDNLRAALDRSLSEPGASTGLRFCESLSRFWSVRGHLSEGRKWCVRVLAAASAQALTLERVKTLNVAGNLARLQGDYSAARKLFEESLMMSRQSEDKRGIASSLSGLGLVAHEQGDYISARKLFEESLVMSRQSGDKSDIAQSLSDLGLVDRALSNLGLDRDQGDYDAALARYRESLAIFRELGDKKSIAKSLWGLGELFRNRSDYDAAIALYEESLAISRELGDKRGIAQSLWGLGEIRNKHGLVLAGKLTEESLAIFRELGDKKSIA